jgi:geranylgeranyl reductase family protein
MTPIPNLLQTDICIVGAGPAGTSAALHLSHLGISCILIDKATFPRDKICGDAISGKIPVLLERLNPQMLTRFEQLTDKHIGVWGIRFVAPNQIALNIPFKSSYDKEREAAPGYVSRRVDFDNFLIDEVQRLDNIDLHLGISIEHFEKNDIGFLLSNKDRSFQVQTKLFIDGSGAHSRFSRHYAGHEKDTQHHAAALRAYYHGVTGFHDDNFIELHFINEIIPGYFWLFPLPNGGANVGIGMRSDFVSKKKVNLKKVMNELIQSHPEIAPRFKHASLEGKITGYGLPLGSKRRSLSGDHYMLSGDAGHLIDPLTGEGIGNGFYSGKIAAEQAVKCLEADDFSAAFIKDYDRRIHRVMGVEMKLSYQIQRMMRYPWLINPLSKWINNNPRFLNIVSRMYADLELRKKLVTPGFWVKLMVGRKV